jgi:hypothetical protein
MRRAYYPEEPTTSSLLFKPTVVFEDHTIQSLCEGYSLIARCKYNGDILGACINETTHCWDPDVKDSLACKVNDVKSRQLLHFYAYMQRVPDLWRKYGVQKIFEVQRPTTLDSISPNFFFKAGLFVREEGRKG